MTLVVAHVASVIAVAVAAVGIVSAVGDSDVPVAVVLAASAATVSGYLVASWRTLPTPLLFAWTALPAIVLNMWTDTEALMFFVVVSVSYCTLVEQRPAVRRAIAAIAIASPLVIEIVSPHDWGWPFWTLGIAFTYASATQSGSSACSSRSSRPPTITLRDKQSSMNAGASPPSCTTSSAIR